jgi:hypothetical protein
VACSFGSVVPVIAANATAVPHVAFVRGDINAEKRTNDTSKVSKDGSTTETGSVSIASVPHVPA